ncbi:hypothetical protein ACQR35_06695 [Pseudarthrobacter sp. J1738]|uniref:hypothetical protein n=1 Tax=Pseudarthrobacter sp. J1738 TaxID=3420446 RepID=UPI003D27A550
MSTQPIMVFASDMYLKINRPQYVSVPEGFISSLAWKVFEWKPEHAGSEKPVAMMFRAKGQTGTQHFDLWETAPKGAALGDFGVSLKEAGIGPSAIDATTLAMSVVNSVTGIRAEKSTHQAASPLTPGFALLQDMRGIQKSKNPPDLAEILESLYSFGGGEIESGVARNWLRAASIRCEIDPLLAAMDSAVFKSLLNDDIQSKTFADGGLENVCGLYPSTPFTWFRRSWDSLTSDVWVEALPARVWVDWATTVLRLALGMGFLWEAAWYETLARKLLSGRPFTQPEVLNDVPQILPWKSSRASMSVRDVASVLVWRVHKGAGVRKQIDSWLKSNSSPNMKFDDAVKQMQGDSSLRNDLTSALGSQTRHAPNTWEAIKYALQTRDIAGPFADYYGLLRSTGRFLTVNPGTEWVAVVASLACKEPRGTTHVGALMDDLSELGLNPELADVVTLLESAGLARGSADADLGVQIKSAF